LYAISCSSSAYATNFYYRLAPKYLLTRLIDPQPGPSYTETQYLNSLLCTLTRPYFERAWVVQEIVLSTHPIAILGSATLSLHILYHLVLHIILFEDHQFEGVFYRIRDLFGTRRLSNIDVARRWLRGESEPGDHFGSFVDALDRFATMSNVSDPRDRIYAFLAFQKDIVGTRIIADYTISTSQAYRRFIVELVQKTDSLAVLGLVRGSDDPGLPSWVVDWNIFTTSPNWKWQGARMDASDYDPYTAAKGRLYRPAITQQMDDMRLVVQGRIIDKVERISSVNRMEEDTYPLESIKLAEELSNLASLVPEDDFRSPFDVDVFAKRIFIVLLGHDHGVTPRKEPPGYTIEELLLMYINFTNTREHDADSNMYFTHRFHYSTPGIMYKRLFVGTKKLLGLAPTWVLPGDQICIVHGSKVPLILRRCNDGEGYTVIGQCYYETHMYGEQVDWEEDEADEFVLV
jgi:hypothetical protein